MSLRVPKNVACWMQPASSYIPRMRNTLVGQHDAFVTCSLTLRRRQARVKENLEGGTWNSRCGTAERSRLAATYRRSLAHVMGTPGCGNPLRSPRARSIANAHCQPLTHVMRTPGCGNPLRSPRARSITIAHCQPLTHMVGNTVQMWDILRQFGDTLYMLMMG